MGYFWYTNFWTFVFQTPPHPTPLSKALLHPPVCMRRAQNVCGPRTPAQPQGPARYHAAHVLRLLL